MPTDLSKERLDDLTATERTILGRLAAITDACVPLEALIEAMKRNGSAAGYPEAMVKVVISRLRKKLSRFNIENTRGVGWKLVPKPEPEPLPTDLDPSEMR